ncbi:MAG: glycosyltransferase [Candidatus Nanoarchaeia archaeon]|nr:glycosyltransferase [Candidatus Nanoarchaeia archaeon]
MKEPFIEIHLVFKTIDKFVLESVAHCLKLQYKNFSILLLPDSKIDFPVKDKRIRVIPTGKFSIPVKRNIGIKNALKKAELIAFVDSDAFPRKDWLSNSLKYFKDEKVMAVGGPNLTPPNEEFRRRIVGNVIEQDIAFGAGALRHKIAKTQPIKELPTCNLIVKRSFLENHLFDETLSTGEDIQLCSLILQNGFVVMYARDVVVFHHRRKIFLQFIKQFYYYGYYKGVLFFRKQLFSWYSVAPSIFLLYLLLGIIFSLFNKTIEVLFLLSVLFYFLILFTSTISTTKNAVQVILTVFSIFLGHISYAVGFLYYFIKRLVLGAEKEKARVISANE